MPERLLIVNADDLGYDPAVTRGILEAMRAGLVTSTTLLVNMPDSEEAARAAGGAPVGLHLNLARGKPVSAAIPGELLAGGELSEANAASLPADAVAEEVHAQLHRAKALLGRQPTHIDVHKHLHRHPAVLDGLCRAAGQHGLPVRAIDARMRQAICERGLRTTDDFIGDAGAEAFWTLERLGAELSRLAEGTTELMCHPGHAPEEIRSGYSAQREVELRTFTDPRALELVRKAGARLGSFADLPR